MDHSLRLKFKDLIIQNDIDGLKDMLSQFPKLANMDLRKDEAQDQFTGSYALVEASKLGHSKVVKVLLDHGADPDAQSTTQEEPPELGLPICFAVEQKKYPLAHLLLDHGASVNAFPYCDKSMIEVLYEQARVEGLERSFIKKGLHRYFGKSEFSSPKNDSPESVKLLHRVLTLGGEPPIGALIRDEQVDILKELIVHHAKREATPMSYPPGEIFSKICGKSSWHGYPEILELCITSRPDLYSKTLALGSIKSAITSHNRDGSIDDYLDIFKLNLDHLKSIGQLEILKHQEPLYPFYRLAKDFGWHNNYGFRAKVFEGEDIIKAAKLFIEYGFSDHDLPFSEDGLAALEIAETRKHHPCIPEFILFLNSL